MTQRLTQASGARVAREPVTAPPSAPALESNVGKGASAPWLVSPAGKSHLSARRRGEGRCLTLPKGFPQAEAGSTLRTRVLTGVAWGLGQQVCRIVSRCSEPCKHSVDTSRFILEGVELASTQGTRGRRSSCQGKEC